MKKLIVITLMYAAFNGAVYSQSMTGWESPQSQATQGRMRSAADDFIRPDNYAGAGIKNWFTMASFRSDKEATLGYAKKFDKLYIAALYTGSFWANLEQFNFTERKDEWIGGYYRNIRDYSDILIDKEPSNRAGILIGAADMGFRLSFYTTHQKFNDSVIRIMETPGVFTYYKSYKTEKGMISPQFAWSVTKNLAKNGIKPWATLDLNFNRDFTKYDKWEEFAGTGINSFYGDCVVNSQNYFQPVFQIGLGGITLINKNGFRLSTDIENSLTLNFYDNEYSYQNYFGIWKTSTVKGLNKNGVITENTSWSDRIRTSLSGQWSSSPFAFRFKLDLNMTFGGSTSTAMEADILNKLRKNGSDSTAAFAAFNPDLRLAMQWRVFPKLALNAGGRVNVNAVRIDNTESDEYKNFVKVDTSKKVNKTFGNTVTSLTLGVTLNPADYLAIEAMTGVQAGSANETGSGKGSVNVFSNGAGGLFNFGSVLVSLKF